MQRTRLTLLIEDLSDQFALWLINPWRRVSLVVISLLLGYFTVLGIAAIAGQAGTQDVVVAILLVLFAELVNWLVYSRPWRDPALLKKVPKPLWIDCLNGFKLGAVYGLALEAFKLSS